MSASLFEKTKILIKAIKVIKNWHLYVALYLNLIKSEHIILESSNGMKIKLRVNSTDIMAFTHVWLLHEYDRSEFEIKDTDVVIDIGAHIGLFALFASQFCKNGKIYCFEPVKENFELLESNLMLNNIKNVISFNAAISINNDNITIYLNKDELEKCYFIKIDCEGEEYAIIDSLSTPYFNKINKMCIEYHFFDTKPELLQNMIDKLKTSYSIKTRKILPSIGFLYAKKNNL